MTLQNLWSRVNVRLSMGQRQTPYNCSLYSEDPGSWNNEFLVTRRTRSLINVTEEKGDSRCTRYTTRVYLWCVRLPNTTSIPWVPDHGSYKTCSSFVTSFVDCPVRRMAIFPSSKDHKCDSNGTMNQWKY